MADITVDVNLPSAISVDITSPTQVLATNISIPGPQGPRGLPMSINSLIADNIVITGSDGNIVYNSGLNTIFISGNSGYFQSAVNSLITNLNSTGANLNTSINSLSGLFTGYTGSLDATYATDSQLNSTGSTLNIKIDDLSGYVNSQDTNLSNNLASTGSSLQTNINTLSSNLNSTGSNLENKITSLSGTLTGNYLTTNVASSTYATISNLNSTGSTLNSSISSLSGTLTSDYATIINLASTGSNLQNQINSLDNIYATDASVTAVANNLASTGSTLETKIGSLSGTLTSDYATITNLASTGSTLDAKINNLSGYVTGADATLITNLASTGSTLNSSINSLSGTLTSTYATINNLASTGSTLATDLASTGLNLDTKINSLSGSSVLLYGDQSVGGVKTFRDNVYINNLFVTGTETIVNTPQINIASNYLLLNLTGGAVDGGIFFVTGVGLTGVNDTGPIIGFDHSNKFKFGVSTRNSDHSTLPDIASVQDIQAYSGVADNKFSTITNLASTGSTLNDSISSLSGALTGNYVTKSNGQFTNRPSVNGTGVLLSGEAAALPTTIVYTTGNQTISGTKIFAGSSNSVNDPIVIIKSDGGQAPYTFRLNDVDQAYTKGDTEGNLAFGAQNFIAFEAGGFGGGAEKMRIQADGKVGIGTNTPLRKFHQSGGKFLINSAEGSYGQFQITNPELGEVTAVFAAEATINEDGTLSSTNNDYTWAFGLGSYGNTPDKFIIGNNNIGNSAFTVTANGNIGIGTNEPSEKLEVVGNILANNLVYNTGNQTITGNKIFNSLRIEPSGRAFNIGTGLNINSESGIVRINTNVSSSLGAGFTYALTSGMDPNRPLDIEGRGRLVHGLSLDAGSANFTNASDHFHLFFSAGPNNPGSFNGRYSTDTNTNYKSYQFSPTTRPNGNDNLRDLIHLTTLEAKGANDQTFPTSNLTKLYLTTTGTTVVTPPGTGLVELAYSINSQPTSQYLHSTGDLVYLRVFPGVAGIVANTYNGTVVTRVTGLDPAYGSTNVYKVGIALGALNVNNNFVPAQRGTSTQTDAWTLTRTTPSNGFTGITRIERNSSQYLDQFNVFYTSPITGYTGESVVVDVFNRGTGTFIASGITLTQGRYDGYVSKVLSSTGLEITLSLMNFGSLGGVGRPGAFHNPPLTTGSAFISSEDLITGLKILRGSSDSVHRNYWAHNVFAGFRNLDATDLNVPAGVITRVAVGGLNRVESGSTSALGFNNKAYGFNSHAYGAHQENYNRDSVRIGATTGSYINIVSGKLGVNVVSPSATIDIGTGNIIAGGLLISGNPVLTGVDLSSSNIVFTTGNQTISGNKTFVQDATFGDTGQGDFLVISGNNFVVYGSGNFTSGLFVNSNPVLTGSSALYATSVNLASTGSTLNTRINNLSGYINSTSSNIVFTTGDQTVSGTKTFATGVNISGHVGIGINNNDKFGLYVRKSSAGAVNPDDGSIAVFEGSGNSHITVLASNAQTAGVVLGSPADNFGSYLSWNHDNNELKLATANPDGYIQLLTNTETQAVRITSAGNVGIGTISPSEKLQVVGNIIANNLVYNTGNQTISGNKTFINNISVSGTGTFFDTSIFVDEMTVSGMNLTVANGTGIFSFLNISGNYDIYSQIENSKKLAIAYAIAL